MEDGIITKDVIVTDEITGTRFLLKDLRDFEDVIYCKEIWGGCFVRIECRGSHEKRSFVFDKNGIVRGWIVDDGIGFTEDFPFSNKEKSLLINAIMVYDKQENSN